MSKKTISDKEYDRIYSRKYRETHPEWKKADNRKRIAQQYKLIREYYKSNPEKRIAHQRVSYAIKLGKLSKKPCALCGASRVVAHHEDYSKPLDVLWLCQKHHKRFHSKFLKVGEIRVAERLVINKQNGQGQPNT